MQEIDFYQRHLDRVSRSFAFCIRQLDPPFRQWVSLSYLLCRALDTIEDSPWSDMRIQNAQYAAFDSFLEHAPQRRDIEDWESRFPDRIPTGEKLLIKDALILFNDLHGLPAGARSTIQETVGKMRNGMQYYSQRSLSGALRLSDLMDVNRYCYFVAGTVGELLTDLFKVHRPEFGPGAAFRKNGVHFGLFLQKINLLKDQGRDELEGRFLVPDRMLLLSSLEENARGALDYLLALPLSEKGFRTFCGWSLFLGLASLPWLERNFEARDGSRIPRSMTENLLAAVEELILDNAAIEEAFEEYLTALRPYEAHHAVQSHHGRYWHDETWFRELAGGALKTQEMFELRML